MHNCEKHLLQLYIFGNTQLLLFTFPYPYLFPCSHATQQWPSSWSCHQQSRRLPCLSRAMSFFTSAIFPCLQNGKMSINTVALLPHDIGCLKAKCRCQLGDWESISGKLMWEFFQIGKISRCVTLIPLRNSSYHHYWQSAHHYPTLDSYERS